MSATSRQTLTARLFNVAGRLKRADMNSAYNAPAVPARLVADCSGIISNADELKVMAYLYFALLDTEGYFGNRDTTILAVINRCFGNRNVIHGVNVIKQMLLDDVIVFSTDRQSEPHPTIGFNRDFLAASVALANSVLERIEELEQTMQHEVPSAEGGDDATGAPAGRGDVMADEEEEEIVDPNDDEDGYDAVSSEITSRRALMNEAVVPEGFVYIPDEAIADTFARIVGICSNDVSSILRSYGVSAIASHYRPKRHDRVVVLLSGAPGTGKTAAAYALADMLQRRLFVTGGDMLKSPLVGMFERNTRRMFDEFKKVSLAEPKAPILLIDECEALFARRGHDTVNAAISRSQNMVTDILLQEIEAFEGILILTTNTPGVFDPAFDRRIDYKLHLDATSVTTQRNVWQLRLPIAMPGAADIDVDALVREFTMTPADITLVVFNVVRSIVSRNPTSHRLTQDDIVRECRAFRGTFNASRRVSKAPFGFI